MNEEKQITMNNAPFYIHCISITIFTVLVIFYYIIVHADSFQEIRDDFSYWKKQIYLYLFFIKDSDTIHHNENPNNIRELLSAF